MLKPFIKWVGGKTQLVKILVKLIEEEFKEYNRYIEPFIGGGALLWRLKPKTFIINDKNVELINLYKIVKNNPNELITFLKEHQINNSKEYFYKIRSLDRNEEYWNPNLTLKQKIEHAARFIYLNKTCFNGMYRVNSLGYFNVPYSNYKNPNIINEEVILDISKFLNITNNKILNLDFDFVINESKKGDLIYFDPPYIPLDESKKFTNYTKDGFDFNEQIRLRDCCVELIEKGVNIILSNSNSEKTYDIYDLKNPTSKFEYLEVNVLRSINSKGDKRKGTKELIIWNKK